MQDNMPDSPSRSTSPPPRREERRRSRSRSPPRKRNDDRQKPRSGGFKWKEKRQDEDRRDGEDEKRLERGYRERDRPRPRSPAREKPVEQATEPPPAEKPKGEKKEKKAAPAPTGEPMIIVHVNDRLGTKAAIPCLASDPIKLFKAQVAARIGREPHEIMLKRQGERPFKDQLTLEDYGVSNGVQLDLEVDTGD
ncbi:MAG: hypothetical protein FRX48_01668 [Lasallia pustulata]|uniref:Ubiquitin-like modifier HUB1 n=1 Tax=Lasallia pustulata TaxID=136370 RepID=A0A5M8Q164_9LECA|nr:MAG: hypothetical protein FRX48_01668 [Lasallia pustulata]